MHWFVPTDAAMAAAFPAIAWRNKALRFDTWFSGRESAPGLSIISRRSDKSLDAASTPPTAGNSFSANAFSSSFASSRRQNTDSLRYRIGWYLQPDHLQSWGAPSGDALRLTWNEMPCGFSFAFRSTQNPGEMPFLIAGFLPWLLSARPMQCAKKTL